MRHAHNTSRGFTLVELMAGMALGVIVMTGAVLMYRQAVNVNTVSTQRTEMQEDFRAAANLLERDISMAGAGTLGQSGLANGSIPVTANPAVYPCSATTCTYVNGTSISYPSQSGAYYLYSIMPGPGLGIAVNGLQSDVITVSYTDANLAMNCYNVAYVSATQLRFTLPATLPATCILPSGLTAPQALNDPVVGLLSGDMIMVTTTSGPAALAVVTSAPSASTCSGQPCYTVTFNTGDPGHINQSSGIGSIASLSGTTLTSAVRQLIITYYLDISPVDGVTPRLMRIQNGKAPVPVTENIVYLKFNYDVDNGGTYYANQSSLPTGTNPGMITKVSIAHMVVRSQMYTVSGYQGLDLQTSLAPRNLTFGQEYPVSGSPY